MLIIAEVGQAHDGSLGNAHAFIDALAGTGVNIIKFQTHIAEAESRINEPFRIKFSYEDEKLSEIKAHFKPVGAWISRVAIPIENGVISGERLNSTLYHVNIDVNVELGNDEIREIFYEADFQVQTLEQ